MEKLGIEYRLTICIFGHAGDGNMHPTIVHEHGDLEAAQRAQEVFGKIVELAQSLGGTASGEHGIGVIKTRFLVNEISETVMQLQKSIKRIFYPNLILNPGKKFR